ncbi:WD40/YVTN/BNR-like repeat-containing protein [Sediminibacillus terrae]|uniref:WD40/YVTN/BNR-like repeat-containing protein n=1 Tax=Sediminibacillus terrae TaxID=1562106 RepID=UPI001297E71E|nr:sialidase family protein [Sediminibacillus terrae]
MKNAKWMLILFIFVLLVIAVVVQIRNQDEEQVEQVPEKQETKTDINGELPYTVQVEERDNKAETIAYRLWFDFMQQLKSDGTVANASFTRFTKISGDENSFVVAIIFQVQLPEGAKKTDNSWGEPNENGVVSNLVWKLGIEKKDGLKYSITSIEKSDDTQIGLPPVETLEDYQKNLGIEDSTDKTAYRVSGSSLEITYNNGEDWQTVPVASEELFSSDRAADSSLREGSYVITPEVTAFVLGGQRDLSLLISNDKGKTWEEVLVSDKLPVLRLTLLGFTSGQDGYLIVTGDKTMSSEAHFIWKTYDGGQSWYQTGSVEYTHALVTDGGFVDNKLGFISFGEYRTEANPPEPNLYRTSDGGENWERVEIPIPEEYQGYFTQAEIPVFEGEKGTLLVNQGPQGDFLGGNVLAKFSSDDNGKTWSFAGLVDPDGVLIPD